MTWSRRHLRRAVAPLPADGRIDVGRGVPRPRRIVHLLLLAAWVGACVGDIGEPAVESPDGSRPSGHASCQGPVEARPAFLRRLSQRELARTLRDELGVIDVDVSALVGTEPTPAGLFSNDARTVSTVGSRQVEGFRALAISVGESVSSEVLGAHTTCDRFEGECTETFVGKLGRRLFRRPLARDEIARYARLFEVARAEGDGFEVGRRLVLEATLQSPHFLYRVEREPTTGSRDVGAHELASRLSYLLWGSSPDAELSRVADDGSLTTLSVLEAQVDRLLDDPRAGAVFVEMVTDWLQLGDLWSVSFDPTIYDEVDADLRVAMIEETHALFRDLWQEDRPLMEMLTWTDAWLSPALARNYGLEPTSSESTRYDLDGAPHRSGLLTRAAIVGLQGQVSRAQSEPEPSVVHRGKFLLERFFCGSIPPPPNDVANDPSFGRGFETEREAVELRSANTRCAGCHASIDPLGLSMLAYDNLGRHRETDVHGYPVSSEGVFVHPQTLAQTRFTDLTQLSAVLASDPTVRACVVQHLLQFAYGDLLHGTGDACIQAEIVEATGAEASFRQVVRAIALHPSYRRISP